MIQVIYDTPSSAFSCLYETMEDAISDISNKEELGWKAEEVKEVVKREESFCSTYLSIFLSSTPST